MNNIIGIWETASDDIQSVRMYGNVILYFKENGELIYQIKENDKMQIIIMTYEVKNNLLITNQPSSPQIETTQFEIDGNYLYLLYDSIACKYVRVS
ncbi:MAG: hypothetical protein E6767_20900 [Dysgonomonas sp.]|nr:hypothetical protein [Dysgonomonas sp.]